MKNLFSVKKIFLTSLFVLLAFWVGYLRGYHRGAEAERRAWEATAEWDRSKVRLSDDARQGRIFYSNPHRRTMTVKSSGRAWVNVPDPRNLPFK